MTGQEGQKSQYKKTFLRMQNLFILMLINTYYAFYGPSKIWSKAVEHLASDDFFDNDTPAKVAISYVNYYGYNDFPHKRLSSRESLLFSQLYLIITELNLHKLTHLFPVGYGVRNKDHTHKVHYEQERGLYRVVHRYAKQGHDLERSVYKKYKFIANKYGWPYISEANDAEY